MTDGGGGEEEDHRVQGGVERGQEEGLLSPVRVLVLDEAHNVGDVVGSKGNGVIQQSGQSQTYGPLLLVGFDVRHDGQDADDTDIAEKGDNEGDTEEDNA